jgi:hypothetical protein
VVVAYNFNVVILVLIIGDSCIGAFLLMILLQFYPCYYFALLFYSCTCWVPTISVLNLAIFPCYSNLLLRRWGWTGILQRGVLGYVLPRLSFPWCYGVFRCSVPLRVVIVFRDTTYVIIILYLWHLVIYEHFWAVCVEQLILGHAYDEYLVFAKKTGYDRSGTRAVSTIGTLVYIEESFS